MLKRFLSCLLLFFLPFASGLVGAEQSEFPIFFTEQASITIDGSADDWPVALPCFLASDSQIRNGARKAPQDFSAAIRLFFDANNAYLFADFADVTPLNNPFVGNDIYKGDALEVYFGFHREDEATTFGEEDAQFGLGLSGKGVENWIWTKGKKFAGQEEIKIVPKDGGYALEARIPLAQFTSTALKPGDPVWFDFAADNNDGGADRAAQLVWNGDGTGWQSPAVWRKGRLFSDERPFKAVYIFTPPQFFTTQFHQVAVWFDGKPWQGDVNVGDKTIKTDEQGKFDYIPEQKGQQVISAEIGGNVVALNINVESKKREKIIQLPVHPIKINQWGYLPEEQKRVVLTVDPNVPLASTAFSVVAMQGGKSVFDGKLEGPTLDEVTGDTLYIGDFSALTAPGKYKISVEGFEKSYPFTIADDAHRGLFYTTMRSYFLQRCGVEIKDSSSKVAHPACHLNDGILKQDESVKRDVTGGWHDAGDYGKYIPTAGVTVAQLAMLYELNPQKFAAFALDLPESGDALPDMLNEVKFELDWMLKMQDSDGGVFHKVNTQNFPGGVMPEADTLTRFIYEKGTTDTAIFVGGMAVAARVFAGVDAAYADTLKQAAINAGAFLLTQKELLWPSNDNTGAYKSESADDELFWAYAELWRLTGESQYLDAALPLFEKLAPIFTAKRPVFGWENTTTFGLYALYLAEKTPADAKNRIRGLLLADADATVAAIQKSGYRMSLAIGEFGWGSNKTACAKGMQLVLTSNYIEKKAEYEQAARAQLDYILGVNPLSKSFLTGIGADRVRYPHHRIFEGSGVVVPGLLSGGPNNNAEDGAYPGGLQAKGYIDSAKSYASNEYAIDYNAPFVFLSGYFMK